MFRSVHAFRTVTDGLGDVEWIGRVATLIVNAMWCRLQKDEEWRDPAAELADFEQLCKDVATE